MPTLILALAALACTRREAAVAADPPHEGAAAAAAASPTVPRRSIAGTIELHESWPRETTLDRPEIVDTADAWIAAIDGARASLDFAEFYGVSREGSAMEGVLAAIDEALVRGVRVRFLFDASFAEREPALIERLRATPGIAVRTWDVKAAMGGVLHAKYFVIDDRAVILGSANFDWRSLEHIVELGAWVESPALARVFAGLFAGDWAAAGGEAPAIGDGEGGLAAAAMGFPIDLSFRGERVAVTPVMSPEGHIPAAGLWDLPKILGLVAGAERTIRLQLLSYQVTGYRGDRFAAIDDALRSAAARGVRVELLVADWNKRQPALGELQALQRVPGITVKLVTIPAASAGFIPYARVAHAKAMIVDGRRAWLGTSNFAGDYFHQSRNVGLVVDGEAFAAALERGFQGLWGSAYAVALDPAAAYEAPRIGP